MIKHSAELLKLLCVPGEPETSFISYRDNMLRTSDGRTYPVVDGIPQLLTSEEYHELSLYFDKKAFSDDKYSAVGYQFSQHYKRIHQAFCNLVINSDPHGEILDIGCGHGELSGKLVPVHKVYGLDISQNMLRQASGKGIISVRGSTKRIPFKNMSIDTCISVELLQHLDELDSFFSEVIRILKPGGRVFVSTLNRGSIVRRVNRGLRGMKHDDDPIQRLAFDVIRPAQKAGFAHVSTTCTYWPFPISTHKLKNKSEINCLASNFILELQRIKNEK